MYMPGQPFGRIRLGDRLRSLREARNVTRLEAAQAIRKRNGDSIRHYEDGNRLIGELELDVLARFYECSEDDIAELEQLYAHASQPGEFASFGLPEGIVTYLELERAAREIRTSQNLIIPGMLQVEPYMRRLFGGRNMLASEIDQQIRARLKRQERLAEDAPQPVKLTAVIAEEALIRCAKVPVQVARLAQFAEQDNIEIRILPIYRGLHRGMDGSFTHLTLGEADLGYEFAYQETASGGQLTDNTSTVRYLVALFEEVRDQALDATESLASISRLARQR